MAVAFTINGKARASTPTPTRRCSGCCATSQTHRHQVRLRRRACAAPAPCTSTARRCAPARPRCPRSRARRSRPSRACRRRAASAAEGLGRRAGAAMRLLPVRPDHAGRRAAGEEQEADARADRRAHGRQHLPLRHLSAHRPRHPARRAGGLSHEQAHQEQPDVSRRGFVQGAAGLTFAFAFGGAPRPSVGGLCRRVSAKLNAWVTIAPTAPSRSSARRPRWARA